MKTFLDDLRNALKKKNINAVEIEDIISDHRDMIESALSEGLSEEEVIAKLGNPEKIAEELADFEEPNTSDEKVDDYQLHESYTIDSKSFNINVEMTSEEVEYCASEDETLKLFYLGVKDLENYTIIYKNGTYTLKSAKFNQFLSFMSKRPKVKFRLEVPKALALESIKHTTMSGNLSIKGLSVENIELSTVSGDIRLTHLQVTNLRWYTVNGDIHVESIHADSIKSSQVSGDLKVYTSNVEKKVDLDTVSGDASFEDTKVDHCKVNSVSGDVTGKEFYPNKVSLSSVSGDIHLYQKEKRHVEIVSKSTLSGTIKIHSN